MKPLWTYLVLLAALCLGGAAVTFAPPPATAAAQHCACPSCPGMATCCCAPAGTPAGDMGVGAACSPPAPVLATVQTAAALPATLLPGLASSPARSTPHAEPLPIPPGRLTPPPAQPPWSA